MVEKISVDEKIKEELKLQTEKIFSNKEKLDVNKLTKILDIPLKDVKNILGI